MAGGALAIMGRIWKAKSYVTVVGLDRQSIVYQYEHWWFSDHIHNLVVLLNMIINHELTCQPIHIKTWLIFPKAPSCGDSNSQQLQKSIQIWISLLLLSCLLLKALHVFEYFCQNSWKTRQFLIWTGGGGLHGICRPTWRIITPIVQDILSRCMNFHFHY